MKVEWKDNYLYFGSRYIASNGLIPMSLNELFKEIYSDSIANAIGTARTNPFLKLLKKK